MDASNRSRSLSTDRTFNHSQSASSPSPHTITDKHNPSSFGLDQPIDFSQTNFNNSNHHLDPSSQQNLFGGSFDLGATSQSFSPQPDLSQTSLFTGQDLGQDTSLGGNFNSDNSLFSDFNTINNNGGFEQNLFPDNPSPSFGQSGAVDPRLLDPSRQSSDPNLLMAAMTSSSSHIQTPPHLLSPSMQRQTSGSPRGSPGLFQGPFPTPPQDHSRGGSLDPSSAAYPQMQNWSGNETFRSHRRTHSDAHSDVSSSAHPSPFLTTQDSFEHTLGSHSPHMGAVADPSLFQDVMSFGQISINDAAQQQSYTPSHSPFTSPALLPQQQHLPVMNNVDNFGLQQNYGGQFQNNFPGSQNLNAYPVSNAELFPTLNQGIPVTTAGQADIMSPPEFKIDLAPPSRQPSFEPPKPDGNEEGLTPPDRSRSRHRMRALSDPFSSASSRGSTPSRDVNNRLSPVPAGVGSRSPSPSAAGKARRSSTSNVPNRDYILDLADPNRPASTATSEGGSASKRTQKHPATFQCTLCPKRFTRAYNLRSHLRTHTDERPFVCSVCGKAFARQHDRKRHEGLHSGEKKFVCRGNLKAGNHWGCGRRFARADALGRHFRSEAGRVCIKPLLEEEAHEKFGVAGQDAQGGMGMMMGSGMQPLQAQGQFDAFGAPQQYDQSMQMAAYRLPAALLAQYPTLGGIWDTLPLNAPDELDGHSGRSSFDASSAGEYDEGEDLSGQGGYSWHSDVGP